MPTPIKLYRFMFFPHDEASDFTIAILPAATENDAMAAGFELLPKGLHTAEKLSRSYFEHAGEDYDEDICETAFFTVVEIESPSELTDTASAMWAEHKIIFGKVQKYATNPAFEDTIAKLLT